MASTNFDALISELRDNPERVHSLDLTDEEMLKLQDHINPYMRIVGPERDPDRPRVVAASFTNLREDYLRRFTMTSLVGFVYRMFEEWAVQPETRRWVPPKVKGESKPFTVDEIADRANSLQENVKILQAAEQAWKDACTAVQEFNEKELVFSEEEMQKVAEAAEASPEETATDPVYQKMQQMDTLMKKAKEAEDRLWGLRYTLSIEFRNYGIESDLRIMETEKAAMKFPTAREVIQSEPYRYKGLLPGGQMEVPEKMAKALIKGFLDNLFEFNPDAHVRKAWDEMVITTQETTVGGIPGKVLVDPSDPDRLPLPVLLAQAPPETNVESDQEPLRAILSPKSGIEQQHAYNVICHLITNPNTAGIARYVLANSPDDPDRLDRWHRMLLPAIAREHIPAIPPNDTFNRWNTYVEVNMEALREATNSIYHEKPDLDFAIALMDTFQGSKADVEKFGEEFRDKYQDEVISEIKIIEMGGWTVLGDFESNRLKANFYNRHTDILERILKRHEDDQKFGEHLMRQRVRKTKAENIRKEGPDAPGLAEYKAHNPTPGGKEVLTATERRRLERAKGNLKAARELEFYEENERIAKDLETQARLRELSTDEAAALKTALENMEKAEEMLNVPDDAIQVDVWTASHTKGTMERTKFYTKAAGPGEAEDERLTAANLAVAKAPELTEEQKKVVGFYPEGSRHLAAEALARGESAPQLAPFAQDFLAKDLEAERERTAATERVAAPGMVPPTEDPSAVPSEALASQIDAVLDSMEDTTPQAPEPSDSS